MTEYLCQSTLTGQSVVPSSGSRSSSTAFTAQRYTSYSLPGWKRHARAKLEQIGDLPDNWDGYGSPAPTPNVLEFVRRALDSLNCEDLPEATIGPESGAAVFVEWEWEGKALELHFLSDRSVEYLTEDADGTEDDGKLQSGDVDGIRLLVAWLMRR